MIQFERSDENPILVPRADEAWEAEGTFNGCPVKDGAVTHFVYRANSATRDVHGVTMSRPTIGYAKSKDGIHFTDRRQLITPTEDWEQFGCEDPRVTKIGDTFYIFYTALAEYPFRAEGIRVAVALTKDFKKIIAKHLVTPFNAKAMALFPDKVNGKYAAILTVHTDMPPSHVGLALFDRIEELWSEAYWEAWYRSLGSHVIQLRRSLEDHLEVGAPPVKTPKGWLILFSYIENYMTPPATFGVHAALLNLKDPLKLIGRTRSSMISPKEEYERYGVVPNIVFPSGALVKGKTLSLYYGAADTTCAVATTPLAPLLKDLSEGAERVAQLFRYKDNPIMRPESGNAWEAKAVFNPAAIYLDGVVHLIYRAVANDNTSVFGYANSTDYFTIDERLPNPVYVPREPFEQKNVPGGNSGCEDPRLTLIGDTIYMCYTAYNGTEPPRVALTSITKKDFLAQRWNWSKPVLISPLDQDDKDAAVFPKKFGGKYAVLHRLSGEIWLDFVDSLEGPWTKPILGKVIMHPRGGVRDSRKIGIAGPPIETEAGWLLIYHGVARNADHHYHLRAALLDKNDPTKVIARTEDEILDTDAPYERYGVVPNVVFSCGAVVIDGQLIVYYGAADTVIGVASMPLAELLKKLKSHRV
jgi:predicted GH43/DUF377 family glycosyl hydrolase